jgi:hypothetical protein
VRRAAVLATWLAAASAVAPAHAQQIDGYCSGQCYGRAAYCSQRCPTEPRQDFLACDARCAGERQSCLNACPLVRYPQPGRY